MEGEAQDMRPSDKEDLVLAIVFFGLGVSTPANDDLLETEGETPPANDT